MRFKLDENLPVDAAVPLTEAGHDVHTVYQEKPVRNLGFKNSGSLPFRKANPYYSGYRFLQYLELSTFEI
jgi:hypothetical protein